MTPEQLEEVPGIGEKTVEKISVAVREYFEAGAERETAEGIESTESTEPAAESTTAHDQAATPPEEDSMEKTPEEILAAEAGIGEAEEATDISTEDIIAAEDAESASDAFSDADAREEAIELDNDTVDTLVAESQEISDEGIDTDGHDRG